MIKSKLPSDRLSNLIRVATTDAKHLYLERGDDYYPYYSEYHMPHKTVWPEETADGKVRCHICDAGAVIAGTLKSDITRGLIPPSFAFHDVSVVDKLRALDYVRLGALAHAHRAFYDEEATPKQKSEYVEMSKLLTNMEFVGWHEFMLHIASLEVLAREMVSFENSWGIGGGAE